MKSCDSPIKTQILMSKVLSKLCNYPKHLRPREISSNLITVLWEEYAIRM